MALLAGIVVVVGILQTNVGHGLLRKAGILQGTTGYTSLSFLNPQSLPEQLQSQRANIKESFVIQNSTSAARDYKWLISLTQNGHTSLVSSGSVSLEPSQKIQVNRPVSINCSRGQARIIINLADSSESISSLMACHS